MEKEEMSVSGRTSAIYGQVVRTVKIATPLGKIAEVAIGEKENTVAHALSKLQGKDSLADVDISRLEVRVNGIISKLTSIIPEGDAMVYVSSKVSGG